MRLGLGQVVQDVISGSSCGQAFLDRLMWVLDEETWGMITFAVTKVDRADKPLPSTTIVESIGNRANRSFEAGACNSSKLVESGGMHGFLAAVHAAFDSHYPLVLSPDDVWLCLAQGLAMHVNLNAEALRHQFVKHEGKTELVVIRDDFVKGSPTNDWPGMFSELSDCIAGHVGKKRGLFVSKFSTTGPIERAASEIVLFDAMQQYFDYSCLTRCGIPEITLLGTAEDWISIRIRVTNFAEFALPPDYKPKTAVKPNPWEKPFDPAHLQKWISAVLPILDKIIRTVRGDVDPVFWQSIYKQNGGSGGPYVTGWINTLFPYLEEQDYRTNQRKPKPNEYALEWSEGLKERYHGGPGDHHFPSGLSCVPFLWKYLGTRIPMVFMGGFAGVSQDPATGAVRPAIGWAIGEK